VGGGEAAIRELCCASESDILWPLGGPAVGWGLPAVVRAPFHVTSARAAEPLKVCIQLVAGCAFAVEEDFCPLLQANVIFHS
jgi:hypothetical protein